jgi:hypothetical protein
VNELYLLVLHTTTRTNSEGLSNSRCTLCTLRPSYSLFRLHTLHLNSAQSCETRFYLHKHGKTLPIHTHITHNNTHTQQSKASLTLDARYAPLSFVLTVLYTRCIMLCVALLRHAFTYEHGKTHSNSQRFLHALHFLPSYSKSC